MSEEFIRPVDVAIVIVSWAVFVIVYAAIQLVALWRDRVKRRRRTSA